MCQGIPWDYMFQGDCSLEWHQLGLPLATTDLLSTVNSEPVAAEYHLGTPATKHGHRWMAPEPGAFIWDESIGDCLSGLGVFAPALKWKAETLM